MTNTETKATPSKSDKHTELKDRVADVLTRLENAVEASTLARVNGRTVNNRMIHAEAMTSITDLIMEEVRAAELRVHGAFQAWLWDKEAGVGTIDDWSRSEITRIKQLTKEAI